MKKSKFLLLFMLTALFVSFSACSSDDDEIVVKPEKTAADIEKDSIITIKITEGNGGYTVTSANEQVAKATVKDNAVTITAVTVGNTSITVKDKEGKTAAITVTVFSIAKEWTAAEAKIDIAGVTSEEAKKIQADFSSYKLKTLSLKSDGKFEIKAVVAKEKEAAAGTTEETSTGTYTYKNKTLTLTFDIEEGDENAEIKTLKIIEFTKSSLKVESDEKESYKEDYPTLTKALVSLSFTSK